MASSQLSTTPPESPPDHDDEEIECDSFDVLETLGDEYTQKVLSVLAEGRITGGELIERTDVSKATVYRRLDDLQDAGIVDSGMRIDPNGHHCEEYFLAVEQLAISFDDDGFAIEKSTGQCSQTPRQPTYQQANADD
jgi:DNA-binding transcriptional ArsR family regulator